MSERFSNDEMVQLLLVIGQYMMVGRIMATAQLEVDAVLGGDVLEGVTQAQARRARPTRPGAQNAGARRAPKTGRFPEHPSDARAASLDGDSAPVSWLHGY